MAPGIEIVHSALGNEIMSPFYFLPTVAMGRLKQHVSTQFSPGLCPGASWSNKNGSCIASSYVVGPLLFVDRLQRRCDKSSAYSPNIRTPPHLLRMIEYILWYNYS